MKRATRKSYHKQANHVIKRENQLKGEKLAARYLYHRSPAIWDDFVKMRGSGKTTDSSGNRFLTVNILLIHLQSIIVIFIILLVLMKKKYSYCMIIFMNV